MGTEEDQTTAVPPHKIIGNIYYVGTRTLSSFLIVTPQGNILVDSTYERNVPVIQKSGRAAGLQVLRRQDSAREPRARRSPGRRRAGKQLTGARVMAMAEDVPALQAMKPGGKEHPIDKVLHDGEEVTLGGTDARRAPDAGPTRGVHQTWTMKAQEGGKTYNVMFAAACRPPGSVDARDCRRVQPIVQARARAAVRRAARAITAAQYNMQGKYAKLQNGGPNPFIDPATCKARAGDLGGDVPHRFSPSSRKRLSENSDSFDEESAP